MNKILLVLVAVLTLAAPLTALAGPDLRSATDKTNCPDPDSYWSVDHCYYHYNESYHDNSYMVQSWTPATNLNTNLYSTYNVPNDGTWYCGLKSALPITTCPAVPVCPAPVVCPLPLNVQTPELSYRTPAKTVKAIQSALFKLGLIKWPKHYGVADPTTRAAFFDLLNSL